MLLAVGALAMVVFVHSWSMRLNFAPDSRTSDMREVGGGGGEFAVLVYSSGGGGATARRDCAAKGQMRPE